MRCSAQRTSLAADGGPQTNHREPPAPEGSFFWPKTVDRRPTASSSGRALHQQLLPRCTEIQIRPALQRER
jgi:hypothetical protein